VGCARFKSPLAHTFLRPQARVGEPPAPHGVVFQHSRHDDPTCRVARVVSSHGRQDGLARPLREGAERHRDFGLYMQ
jgi:hypothetical protein